MAIQLMLAASLRKYVPGYDGNTGYIVSAPPGSTVRDIAKLLSIPADEIKLIMVEGAAADFDTILAGNERVAFFPPIGGG